MHNVPKWPDTLQMLKDFYGVSDHFGTLCIKGLKQVFYRTGILFFVFKCLSETFSKSTKWSVNTFQKRETHFTPSY